MLTLSECAARIGVAAVGAQQDRADTPNNLITQVKPNAARAQIDSVMRVMNTPPMLLAEQRLTLVKTWRNKNV